MQPKTLDLQLKNCNGLIKAAGYEIAKIVGKDIGELQKHLQEGL